MTNTRSSPISGISGCHGSIYFSGKRGAVENCQRYKGTTVQGYKGFNSQDFRARISLVSIDDINLQSLINLSASALSRYPISYPIIS